MRPPMSISVTDKLRKPLKEISTEENPIQPMMPKTSYKLDIGD